MKLAAIQMTSTDDLEGNLQQAEALLKEAAQGGAKLAVLPEVFAFYGPTAQALAHSQAERTPAGPVRRFIAEQAKALNMYLLAGSFACSADETNGQGLAPNKAFASSFLISPTGEELARYNKLHLFDVEVDDEQGSYRESDTYQAGSQLVDVDLGFAHLGLTICYDLRFPELYRALYQRGVNLFAVPAAFTYTTGKAHWLTLLKARAIENNAYIVAANQTGWHNPKRRSYGHSCIISPWGEVLALREEGSGVVVAEFDLAVVEKQRRQLPLHQHQRLAIGDKPCSVKR